MRCDRARVVASARTDGEATSREVRLLDEHLATCAGCRAFDASAGRVRQALAVGRAQGAPDVTDAVLTRLGLDAGSAASAAPVAPVVPPGVVARRARSRGGAGRRARRRSGSSSGGPRLVTAAAVLVVVVVAASAFWVGRLQRPDGSVEVRGGRPPGDAPAPAATPWTGSRAVVWSRDRVGPELAAEVDALPAVARTAVVARGTVGLSASETADGTAVDVPGDGWTIPLDVIAFDPASYGPLVGGPDARTLRRLRPGQAVLGASSARLRDLGVGARLDVAGEHLRVVAVVPDRSVGAAEVAVDRETGARIGVTVDRYVVVGYRGDAGALADAVVGASTVPTRVRDEADTPFLRNGDAVLPQVQVKERFGEFATRVGGEDVEVDPAWFEADLERVELPLVGAVTCHRRVVPALRAVLADLEAEGLGGLLAPDRLQGCWTPKEIRATGDLSHHTWGAAIDLAPIVVDGARTQDPRLVAAFERHGFTWGGTWLVPDPEHFELLDLPPG